MSHVLITFLGKGEKGTDGFYKPEQYHFENDDTPYYETNFFGLAVLKHLINTNSPPKKFPPDKLVVLGTPSSMWNGFYELDGEVKPQHETAWATLGDAINENTDYPEEEDIEKGRIVGHLATLTTVLSQHLNGIECDLRVISYGENQEGQIAILKEMAECVEENDTVSLDITHGLRHLPMLVVLSAMYLQIVKKVEIEGIYYGAKEMNIRHDNIAPALNLRGLLGIADWVRALNSFEKDGDYAVFGKLLKADGFSKTQIKPLEEAAFFERIFNVPQAAKKLTAFRNQMPTNLPGIGHLFSDTINERTLWATQNNLYERQRGLADFYLKNGDYPRSAIFAVEAFITHLCMLSHRDIRKYDERRKAELAFFEINHTELKGRFVISEQERADFQTAFDQIKDKKTKEIDFETLKQLRNRMAHSNTPQGKVKTIMESQNSLKSKLTELMARLLKG